ncbi:DUF535 family protein [Massilia sp. S19_KUP03_FR1]|uniref:DUF535 family protein n=1 Tax=Massilia sp. S19_KUP03_FR1 TaxID=3025503 RepID=UPI002FCDD2AB
MIVTHLLCHWRTYRRRDAFAASLLRAARILRVLFYRRDHAALCRLAVVREHIAQVVPHDVFHHLTQRGYLMRGLSARRRVQAALFHYSYDDATFDQAWQRAVYRQGGLRLWQHDAHGCRFFIRLEMAVRLDAEGDLTIALVANNKVLHRLSFSWVDGALFNAAHPVLPFIARNQGRWTDSSDAFAAFEAAFPHNSASYFCFAALQGVARALGMTQVLAVNSAAHIAWRVGAAPHFVNAYDKFWAVLGGVPHDDCCHAIALPFHTKPLAQMPSRHRKRAARRRANWQAIDASAHTVMLGHLQAAPLARIMETVDA